MSYGHSFRSGYRESSSSIAVESLTDGSCDVVGVNRGILVEGFLCDKVLIGAFADNGALGQEVDQVRLRSEGKIRFKNGHA